MKLSGIQIARGLASFSIAYFHSWVILLSFPKDTDKPIQVLKLWGYLSIDFFFAISGFVICLVATRPGFTVKSFLIKRAFRLYPMYWLCLAAYAATGILRGPVPTETVWYFLYSATLLPTNGYPFYDVAWSLQHEMLFYVLAALTIPLFGLRGLAVLLLASASAAIWLDIPLHNLPMSKYHADFLAGVLVFMAQPYLKRLGSVALFIVGALLLYFVAHMGYTDYFCFPFFALLTAAANFESKEPPAELLGDVSYSLYLVHPLVFGIGYKVVGMLQPLPIWTEEPIRWAALIVCVAVSYATWKIIEIPAIRFGEELAVRKAPLLRSS
jgi:peptidoglycan/LPS O-acetylase OafA/YrhL